MKHIKKYLNQRKVLYEAKRWLKSGNADRIAARCLFHLNHEAQMYGWSDVKEAIYALKTLVIRDFYERGCCMAVTKHLQTLTCWHDWEYLNGWTDVCRKCEGTGIYASHELYQFVFDIGGRTYVWHQPVNLVDFQVELIDQKMTEYRSGKLTTNDLIGTEWIILYQAVLYQYLRAAGIQTDELPKLSSWKTAIHEQWYKPLRHKWHWDWEPRVSRCWENLNRLWTGELPKPDLSESEDEIPFYEIPF